MTPARVQSLKLSDQVTRVLAGRIVNGDIGVAELPPTEQDICEEFGVSKTTAREVIGSTSVETAQGISIDPDQVLYALHGADGARLAVLGDRESAIAAALAHELAPVAVH